MVMMIRLAAVAAACLIAAACGPVKKSYYGASFFGNQEMAGRVAAEVSYKNPNALPIDGIQDASHARLATKQSGVAEEPGYVERDWDAIRMLAGKTMIVEEAAFYFMGNRKANALLQNYKYEKAYTFEGYYVTSDGQLCFYRPRAIHLRGNSGFTGRWWYENGSNWCFGLEIENGKVKLGHGRQLFRSGTLFEGDILNLHGDIFWRLDKQYDLKRRS